jgi:hypothetical protein
MCFSYGDEDGEILQWCQGTIIRILREETTYMTVEIKWDKECLMVGDREVSQDKLMQSKWNPASTSKERGEKTCIIWPKLQKIYKIIMIYHYEGLCFDYS